MSEKNLFVALIFFTIHCSLFSAYSQSWQELMDSTNFYQEKQDYQTALVWAEKAEVKAKEEFGENDTNYIATLFKIQDCYYYMGKAENVIAYCEKSKQLIKEILGEECQKYAQVVDNLGVIYLSLGNYKQSEFLLHESLNLRRRIFKGNHLDLASSINNMAALYISMGRYTEAEPLFREALEMNKCLYKGDHPSLANSINNMAALYNYMGRLTEAEPLFREALEMRRRLFKGDHPDLASSINSMAVFCISLGLNSEAEQLYKEALEISRRLFKGDHPDLAIYIENMATLYNSIGRYTEAVPLYKEAMEMRKRIFKGDHPDLASSINNMAIFFGDRGDYKQAEPLYKEALEMRRRIFKGDHPDLASSINNMAIFFGDRGDYKQAEPLYEEALEMRRRIFKGDHPDLALSIICVATFYNDRGDYEKAEPLFNEARKMYSHIYKGDNPYLASTIHNMAVFYSDRGDYEQAEPMFKESLEMHWRINKSDKPALALCIGNMAMLYKNKGDYRQAEPLFKEAMEMRRRIFKSDYPDLALSIKNMSAFYEDQGRYTDAEPFYLEVLQVYSNILNNYFPSLSEKEKGQFWNTMNNNFVRFNSFAINRMKDNSQILGNLFNLQLFTKSILFNTANKIKKRILASNDSILISQYRELINKKELLYKLYSTPVAQVKKQGYNIDSIETIANDLEKQISLKSEDYKQSYEKKKISWKTIQALLKPDEAAVEMIRFPFYDKRWTDTIYYAALIITDQTIEHPDIVIIENGIELEEKYYAMYRNFMKKQIPDNESFGVFWQKLYDKLKDYKKIYFSPDGIYNKLNISTMLMPNGKYLLDEQQIHTLNSTQDILLGLYSKQEESNMYNSCELFGNPDFLLNPQKMKEIEQKYASLREMERSVDTTKTLTLQPLPGTEKEVKNISDFFKSRKWVVNMHTGDDAVKAAVKTVNNPRVLHIATHGLFLTDIKPDDKDILGMEGTRVIENPLLRSGLFFAGASKAIEEGFNPTGYDNGFLTAYEAQNMDLDRTELVVLSACETGLGEIHNGEGVFGLQRAFQQAGAKSVLMSLWKVNDEATQELMTTFYKEWVSGKTKREAFNTAQKKIKDKYKHPYYWGAFVMVGE